MFEPEESNPIAGIISKLQSERSIRMAQAIASQVATQRARNETQSLPSEIAARIAQTQGQNLSNQYYGRKSEAEIGQRLAMAKGQEIENEFSPEEKRLGNLLSRQKYDIIKGNIDAGRPVSGNGNLFNPKGTNFTGGQRSTDPLTGITTIVPTTNVMGRLQRGIFGADMAANVFKEIMPKLSPYLGAAGKAKNAYDITTENVSQIPGMGWLKDVERSKRLGLYNSAIQGDITNIAETLMNAYNLNGTAHALEKTSQIARPLPSDTAETYKIRVDDQLKELALRSGRMTQLAGGGFQYTDPNQVAAQEGMPATGAPNQESGAPTLPVTGAQAQKLQQFGQQVNQREAQQLGLPNGYTMQDVMTTAAQHNISPQEVIRKLKEKYHGT